MKKVLEIFVIVVIALILLAIVLVVIVPPIQNAIVLNGLVRDFKKTLENDYGIEVIEMQSASGKLCGNGNGINQFGTALVRADSVSDVGALVAELGERFGYADYWVQEGQEIDSRYNEHQRMKYSTLLADDLEYYSICFFTSSKYSNLLDLSGH